MGLSAMRVSTPEQATESCSSARSSCSARQARQARRSASRRQFNANTSKKRTYSLFRQGCMYYEFLPGMWPGWAELKVRGNMRVMAQARGEEGLSSLLLFLDSRLLGALGSSDPQPKVASQLSGPTPREQMGWPRSSGAISGQVAVEEK